LRLLQQNAPEEQPVLIAGRDSAGRAAVLRELSRTMPADTLFEQAGAFWEVLERAPAISMVILSGELDEVPAESLLGMLAHRHPDLPVVSLDPPKPLAEARARR
jgi:DNA-binding NtrC family response regulator